MSFALLAGLGRHHSMNRKIIEQFPSMYIQYENVFLGIYMIYLSLHCECQLASHATELVVKLATICRVNIG